MTTNEMKEIIRNKIDSAWIRLCHYSDAFGKEDEQTIISRYKWATLDNLWYELFPDEEYQCRVKRW